VRAVVRTDSAGRSALDPEGLAAATGGSWLTRPAEGTPLLGAAIDSRRVRPGSLFFALRGERTDGHRFLAAARDAGAGAAVVEDDPTTLGVDPGAIVGLGVLRVASAPDALRSLAEAYRAALGGVRVIGVTGSNGKTTTVRLIHAALAGAGLSGSHAQKSENNDLGLPLTILNAAPAHDYLICEIGTNAPGEIADLASLARPDIGVITSIGRAHIERLGSVAGIAREKAALVRAVPAGGVAVVTAESAELDHALSDAGGGAPACGVVRVGVSAGADVEVRGVETGGGATRFVALGRTVSVPMPGAHSAVNAAIALAVAEACGADLDRAAAGLGSVVPPEMRLERSAVRAKGGTITLINDAYNANPESVRAALGMLASGALDPVPSGASSGRPRRVAVLGDMLEMGEHTESVHREVLGLASGSDGIDRTICVGPALARAGSDASPDGRAAGPDR
jgi:UDP-N-acetylmuramoyl-tripeptide--D-alanyl-D-alanine ligase